MKFIFLAFLILSCSISYANSLTTENVNTDHISKLLPPNWKVLEVKSVDSPMGWTKTLGDKGIQITLSRTPYSSEPVKTKIGDLEIYHPKFIFCIMPNDFSGIDGNGISFKNGTFIHPKSVSNRAMLILNNVKQTNNYYFFYPDTYFKDWENPEEIFDKVIIKN